MEEKRDSGVQFKLIRHAQSEWNAAEKVHGTEKIKYNPEYIDPSLTDKGFKQAKSANDSLRKQPVDFVFVSPLRRALQTASILFQDNPGNPKIIALPLITEKFGCAGDLWSDYTTIKEEFKLVDFSLIDGLLNPDFWYLEMLTNTKKKALMLKTLKDDCALNEVSKPAEAILKEIKKTGQKPEDTSELTARVVLTHEFLRKFTAENGLDKKYALVSHAAYLKVFTKTLLNKGEWFSNCEIKDHFIRFDL